MPKKTNLTLGLAALLMSTATMIPAGASAASELRVAATITPVHSLVSMVTDGVVVPDLIVRPGASPHNYALKPSEAQALDSAAVIFWVGEGLETWMTKPLATLAGDAVVVELGEVDGVEHLDFREGGVWAAHDHDHDDEKDHDHAEHHDDEEHHDHAEHHDDEEDHDHAEHHDDEEHHDHAEHHDDEEHHDHAEHHDDEEHHDHAGGFDPHLWLGPDNALVWLGVIADTLAEHDPEHAEDYRKNATDAAAVIAATVTEIEGLLLPVKEEPYVVFHDAYQYFEKRFDMHPVGSISLGDADKPGPARLREIKETIATRGAVCIFAEPQFEPKLIDTVTEGAEVKRGMLDPIGADLEPGAGLYPQLIRNLGESLAGCLG